MRNLIRVIFISIAFILFACHKNKTPEPTPDPTPVVNYTGDYAGKYLQVETYPNNQTKTPRTKVSGYNTTIVKKNSKGHYLYDLAFREDLYFASNSIKKISKGKTISQASYSQSISVKWEIKGDSLIGTTIENLNFDKSGKSINNTKNTFTYNLKLKK
jgi:hypothetical protein